MLQIKTTEGIYCLLWVKYPSTFHLNWQYSPSCLGLQTTQISNILPMLCTLLIASIGALLSLILTTNIYWMVIVCQVFSQLLYMYQLISFLESKKPTRIPISHKEEQRLIHIQLAAGNTRSKFQSRIPSLPHPLAQSYLTIPCSWSLSWCSQSQETFPLDDHYSSPSVLLPRCFSYLTLKYADWFKNIYKQWTTLGTGYSKVSKSICHWVTQSQVR